MSFSVCVLLYGDYPTLAQRCLDSISDSFLTSAETHIGDIRIGLNAVSETTRQYADKWANSVKYPVLLYTPDRNAFKYPLMRRMFYDEPLQEHAMWFDDDSFLEPRSNWWSSIKQVMGDNDVMGQFPWRQGVIGNQWAWVQNQPWYNPQVGMPPNVRGQPRFHFCQGGWWVARSEILQRYDWPIPELRHCGGDSMFGELCRHQGLNVVNYDKGVRINADELGQHSKAVRRGHSEHRIGYNYKPDVVVDLSHQNFEVEIRRVDSSSVRLH